MALIDWLIDLFLVLIGYGIFSNIYNGIKTGVIQLTRGTVNRRESQGMFYLSVILLIMAGIAVFGIILLRVLYSMSVLK